MKTELEFRFRWGSQKLEPKIGIPNQGYNRAPKYTGANLRHWDNSRDQKYTGRNVTTVYWIYIQHYFVILIE